MGTRRAIFVLLGLALGGCGDRAEAPTTTQPTAPNSPTTPAPHPQTTPAQRLCPVCGQPVPTEAKYCRKCGSRLQ